MGPGSTVFGEYRGIESIIQLSYFPLAWRGERNGEGEPRSGRARQGLRVIPWAPARLSAGVKPV